MAPGELVELFDYCQINDYIVVGDLNNTVDLRRRFPLGTFVLLMGEYPGRTCIYDLDRWQARLGLGL